MDYDTLKESLIEKLKGIYDPEIPVNIYDLGLIYNIDFEKETEGEIAKITMTLTSAACPMSESIVEQVRNTSYLIDELVRTDVELVFDPPWSQDSMGDEAKLQLGML